MCDQLSAPCEGFREARLRVYGEDGRYAVDVEYVTPNLPLTGGSIATPPLASPNPERATGPDNSAGGDARSVTNTGMGMGTGIDYVQEPDPERPEQPAPHPARGNRTHNAAWVPQQPPTALDDVFPLDVIVQEEHYRHFLTKAELDKQGPSDLRSPLFLDTTQLDSQKWEILPQGGRLKRPVRILASRIVNADGSVRPSHVRVVDVVGIVERLQGDLFSTD